ncbi:FkbM family methyltransferase [Gymnodinialimonas sp. 57CJ19]|uniref:FkbM family methyltransferase n=1 Tax=Gymnodinialimonas sp. 57CJ19 TaxID=3138498 RepID=UPI0031345742
MSVPFDADRARAMIEILSPERRTRVVDIGANPLDETPYKGLLSIGACDVWGFEPQRAAFDKLMEAKGPRENYLCAAVGDGNRAELKVCADSGFTSLLEPNLALAEATGQFRDRVKVLERIEMDTTRLDDLDEIPQFDLLKIDIQGGEQMVFRNGPKAISQALAVITEVAALPIYEGQPLLHDQLNELAQHGFYLHKFLFMKAIGFRNPHSARLSRGLYRSQVSDGDAALVRGMTDMASLKTEELKHLAILADSVLLTQDLAVVAMTELVKRDVLTDDAVHDYIDLLPRVRPHARAAGGGAN